MIETPNSNISLTFEQMAQIDTVKKTLANIENEITIAQKNLSILNKEVVKATKEREYQEELLVKLNAEIPIKQSEKEKLEKDVSEMTEHLAKIKEAEGV